MPITVTPAGSITLVKEKLESDYKNTYTFSSLSAQTSYFDGLSSKILAGNDYTYVKKDNKIRVSNPIDTIINYNYLYYNNGGFTNKRYYCFITRMEYVNENCTDVYIQTDAFQTWYFDLQWNRCFVEREHVNNDTIGDHTVPENLETGEYIINNAGKVTSKLQTCYICMAVTWIPDNTPDLDNVNRMYNSLYSGTTLILFRNASDCSNFIKCYDKMGHGDAITNLYMLPISATGIDPEAGSNVWKTYTYDNISTEFCLCPYSTGVMMLEQNLTYNINTTINGYTPKNGKLFTYPYNYLSISNNNGTQVDFKYEEFINAQPIFDIGCCVTAGAQNMMIPKNYKLNSGTVGYDVFYTYAINGGKYPTCSWNSDAYINWLTQNSVNIASSLAGDIGSIALGGAMLSSGMSFSGTGSLIGGVTGISSTLGTIYQHAHQSPTLKGQTSSGDYTYSWGNSTFTYYRMSIKYEYAKIIDDYFSMFGYKVNSVKIPNITGRNYWNFIKTIDCNVDGDIPQEDLETIRKACNSGITFWHSPSNIYNYSLTNSIVS